MKLSIEAEPKEIAAFVVALQERQEIKMGLTAVTCSPSTEADREKLAQTIRSVLFSQIASAENQEQQLDATTHTQNQGKVYPVDVSDCELE